MTHISLDDILKEALKRILAVVQLRKVLLFGSAVRREMHKDSVIEVTEGGIGQFKNCMWLKSLPQSK